jgi:ribose 5-phosphate isomerase A
VACYASTGLGIPLASLEDVDALDVAIDGADEVDTNLELVKGRGGALLREKMVELNATTFVVIVDDSKHVSQLGASKDAMPVEVVPFCWQFNRRKIESLPEVAGCTAKRREENGEPYVTDNGNYIVDLYFDGKYIEDPNAAARALNSLVGVVEHGLFLGMTDVCITAGANGVEVKEHSKKALR